MQERISSAEGQDKALTPQGDKYLAPGKAEGLLVPLPENSHQLHELKLLLLFESDLLTAKGLQLPSILPVLPEDLFPVGGLKSPFTVSRASF